MKNPSMVRPSPRRAGARKGKTDACLPRVRKNIDLLGAREGLDLRAPFSSPRQEIRESSKLCPQFPASYSCLNI